MDYVPNWLGQRRGTRYVLRDPQIISRLLKEREREERADLRLLLWLCVAGLKENSASFRYDYHTGLSSLRENPATEQRATNQAVATTYSSLSFEPIRYVYLDTNTTYTRANMYPKHSGSKLLKVSLILNSPSGSAFDAENKFDIIEIFIDVSEFFFRRNLPYGV